MPRWTNHYLEHASRLPLLDEFLQTKSYSTAVIYRGFLGKFAAWLTGRDSCDLAYPSTWDVSLKEYRDWLAQSIKKKSTPCYLSATRQYLAYLNQQGLYTK